MILRILLLGLLLAARPAWAVLDGPPLPGPAAEVQSTAATTAQGVPYTVLHRTLHDGLVLDEFVDAGGNVFALDWSGPFKPDLKELLGARFDSFHKAAEAHPSRSRAGVSVDAGDVVVLSGGHVGAFQGRAWVAARLPAGFDPKGMK